MSGKLYDVRGAVVIPALTECHTHAIFAGDRAAEFHARIQGETYHDQQKKGGINATVSATRDATDEALLNNLEHWLEVFLGQGATAVEVKSGYGLSHDQEIRLLRIINRAKARGARCGSDSYLFGRSRCAQGTRKPRRLH